MKFLNFSDEEISKAYELVQMTYDQKTVPARQLHMADLLLKSVRIIEALIKHQNRNNEI